MQTPLKALPTGFFRNNQKRLFDLMAQHFGTASNSLVVLSGPVTTPHVDDDALSYNFPEKLFYFLTGVHSDPKTYALLDLLDRKVFLFSSPFDPSELIWGKKKAPEDFKKEFEVDDAFYVDKIGEIIAERFKAERKDQVYVFKGTNPYSSLPTLSPEVVLAKYLDRFNPNTTDFYEVGTEVRVRKSAEEIAVLHAAAQASVYVHKQIMKQLRPGMSELDVCNLFSSIRVSQGGSVPYPNIVASGVNASYLHYELSHNRELKDGDLLLLDAACQLHGYNSDITRTLPVSGKFSAKQADMYNAVHAAQAAALAVIKPGVNWVDVHVAAEKSLLKSLLEKGLVKGDLEEMWTKRVIYYFFPHGVGHYIGLYTHDLPGLKSKENNWTPIPKLNLRVKRVLEEGMVFTVEPGVYFNRAILDAAYKDVTISGYFNKETIEAYAQEVGGIRLEDVVHVTAQGFEMLTQDLPRSLQEIEAFMKK